jgi:hypothetical protein
MRATSDAVVVEFPLRGEWAAVRTPAHRVPSHGTDMLGQRYAFDFVRPDHRRGLRLRARVHMVGELAHALTTTVRFDPARGVDSVAGNHVILQGADAYAVFAHLVPGTVSVTTGHRIRAGEVIGRVGHTGNSTAPHLHFHLMDSPDPLRANGIPCAFEEYLAQRDGGWERVERGVPGRYERIRSVA